MNFEIVAVFFFFFFRQLKLDAGQCIIFHFQDIFAVFSLRAILLLEISCMEIIKTGAKIYVLGCSVKLSL